MGIDLRFTHPVGISNRRLLQLDRTAGTASFDCKDYADGARHKSMALGLGELLRRLRLHFLPPRFVKIRHFGLLTNRQRQQRLARARALLAPGQPDPPPPEPEPHRANEEERVQVALPFERR